MNRRGYHYAVDQNLVCTTWKDNKVVNVLSNCCVETGNSTMHRKCCVMVYLSENKFCALPFYFYMGSVDLRDQLKKSHGIDCKFRRSYIRPFHHFFDICVVNSYVL